MDDATQKLVDEARGVARSLRAFQPKPGEWASGGVHNNDHKAGVVDALADALEAAQRPPVSPEARDELARTKVPIIDASGETHWVDLGYECADAILARFSVPSQPVYDEAAAALMEFVQSGGSQVNGPDEYPEIRPTIREGLGL